MAREKGMGSLQQEKSGRWTVRIGINGKRISRSARTTDRAKAERFLMRMLAPLGRGEHRLPLAEVWNEYVKSPNRNDLAKATLDAKRCVWMSFAKWMEHNHLEVSDLAGVTHETITEYLACLRAELCASTYNNRVCVLREIFHILAAKAGINEDPWEGVRLRVNDSHSRRELTIAEVQRLLDAAAKQDASESPGAREWKTLFLIGIYTGLRLGDCCRLERESINLTEGIIQLIPTKTRRHAHGHPVTIPIHPDLARELISPTSAPTERYILPTLAVAYQTQKWIVTNGIAKIFKSAGITTSVRLEGRKTRTPEATFHSLRHTFVSLAANAGVPLHIVQSIVGHESTAMTRHYYHENATALRQAVASIPSFENTKPLEHDSPPSTQPQLTPELFNEMHRVYNVLKGFFN